MSFHVVEYTSNPSDSRRKATVKDLQQFVPDDKEIVRVIAMTSTKNTSTEFVKTFAVELRDKPATTEAPTV